MHSHVPSSLAARSPAKPQAAGPLHGIRIIDMTSVLMGPFATQLLGDMGADVIKIEAPGGDITREIGPMRHAGMGSIFLHANRNKRSVVLDLKRPEGRDALLRLAATADVLVYNVRPQAMRRLQLSYADVAKACPDIVYAGIHGFGQEGRYADRPAYDDLIQGACAIPALTLLAGGESPRYAPSAMADRIVGLSAVNVILSALFHRERTGEGQAIEIPMFETMAQFVLSDHMGGMSFDPPLGPAGYPRILNPHRKPYATRDGHLCVLFYTDRHWQAFFELTRQPSLLKDDSRFSTIGARTEHIHELYALVARVMTTRTTAEWTEAFEKADIPMMPMHTLDTLLDDPHLDDVGFFELHEHPTEGRIRSMRTPARWSKTPPAPQRHAPRLGQHGAEVLREAGYADEEVSALLAKSVLQTDSLHATP
ncbi:MAG TPA: CoA transferase [Rhodocyclaceae bacterium]|nr:CoA transferase [Rhodocyclaceae bacterium]